MKRFTVYQHKLKYHSNYLKIFIDDKQNIKVAKREVVS